MKQVLIAALMFSAGAAQAQQVITQATISANTTFVVPNDDELTNAQGQDGNARGMQMFRAMMDGDIKSTVFVKNDMVKTIVKTEMGRFTIIRDNAAKTTTTLTEMMGNKNGFVATDSASEVMRRRMDSTMRARGADSSAGMRRSQEKPAVEIVYTEESKKIAGYNCKKAYVVSTRLLGLKDSAAVWYTPEFKIANLTSIGGMMGMGNMGATNTSNGFDKINGFVMSYEMKMRGNRKMTVEVTKVDLKKEIADKEFDIPKDFEIKQMSEMQGGFGGPGAGQFRRQN